MSHTTDDLIFQWDPEVPLVVDENIELPQLELVQNRTADCTQVYSTGKLSFCAIRIYPGLNPNLKIQYAVYILISFDC